MKEATVTIGLWAGSLSSGEIQAKARCFPVERSQPPGSRQSDIRGTQVRAAEADVGRKFIRHGHLSHHAAIGRDDRDAAGMQGGHGNVAARLNGQAIEALETAKAGNDAATVWRGPSLFLHHARRFNVE